MLQIGFNKMTFDSEGQCTHQWLCLQCSAYNRFFSLLLNIITNITNVSNGSTAAELPIALMAVSNANLLINDARLRC